MLTISLNINNVWTAFTPIFNGSLKNEKPEGEIYNRLTYDGTLIFYKNDFETLLTYRNANDNCIIQCQIYQNGIFQIKGEISLKKTDDFDARQMELNVKTVDVYTPIMDNKATEYNCYEINSILVNKIDDNRDNDRCKRFYDYNDYSILTFLIKKMYADSDYTIYYSKTNVLETDSFYYFFSQAKYKNLLFSQISDMFFNEDSQIYSPATIWNLSFEKITDFLKKKFHVYYQIITIAGRNVFQLRHKTEINKEFGTLPAHDLRLYYGFNWSKNFNKQTWREEEYPNRYKRTLMASNADFVGKDLVLPNIISKQQEDVQLDSIHTDVNHILTDRTAYSKEQKNQFFILSCDEIINYINRDSADNISFESLTDAVTTIYITTKPLSPELIEKAIIKLAEIDKVINNYAITINFNFNNISGTGLIFTISFSASNDELTWVEFSDKITFTSTGDYELVVVPTNNYSFGRINLQKDSGYAAGDVEFSDITIHRSTFGTRTATGKITNTPILNADLSLANTDFYDIADMPDKTVKINDVTTILASNRLIDQREQIMLYAPVNDMKNAFDFTKLVKTDLNLSMRLQSVTLDAKPDLAQITLRY